MEPYSDDYLSKMLPEFEKKPRQETLAPSPKRNPSVPARAPSVNPASELFDSIAAHISRYLACDPHQLTVLTLWAVHTWCFRSSRTAAYLDVRSPEPQSGKSLCLMLLRDLVSNPSFSAGVSAATFTGYLLTDANRVDGNKFNITVLLDACQHTFGPSERQPLVALLTSGADPNLCYFASGKEYSFFGPKAFAGNAPLPRSLAVRSIPITLRRKKPSEVLTRYDQESVREAATVLVDELAPWLSRNRPSLEVASQNPPPRFPVGLTPHEQASVEPLLHIADLVGGSWPENARSAISMIFQLAEGTVTVDLLGDIRDIFYRHGDPVRLPTHEILSALRDLEHRPWSGWGRNSGKKLGHLLHPLRISSRYFNQGSASGFRGYYFEHFQDAWERYIRPAVKECETKNPSEMDSETNICKKSKKLIGKSESTPISAECLLKD